MHFLTREFVDSTLSAKAPVSWITLSRKVDEKRRVSPVINLLRSSGGAKSSFSLSLSLSYSLLKSYDDDLGLFELAGHSN